MEQFFMQLMELLLMIGLQFLTALPFFFFGGVFALWIWHRGKRRRALKRLADQLGMRFYPKKNEKVVAHFGLLNQLQRGYNRHAYHVFTGSYRGHGVFMFDFHFDTALSVLSNDSSEPVYDFTVFVCILERRFPELRICPERWKGFLGKFVNGDDIDFDSLEFSQAFTVQSPDRRFAFDVCSPKMMEFLLDFPWVSLELEGNHLAIWSAKRLPPEEFVRWLNLLIAVREEIPAHVINDDRYEEVPVHG